MKYNKHFANHFRSCRLLVEGFDPHRQRKVEVRLIPGEFNVVGVTDGVDSWVAPVTVAPSDLFDKVRRIIHDLQAGKELPVVTPATLHRVRKPLVLPSEDPPPGTEQEHQPRRRLLTVPTTPTPRPRRVIPT